MSELFIRKDDRLERAVRLTGDTLTVGRSPSADITIRDRTISTNHAVLLQREGRWMVRDLGSTNGTKVNGARVRERYLEPGDEVTVGNRILQFEGDLDPELLAEAPPPADEVQPTADPSWGDTLKMSMSSLAAEVLEPETDPLGPAGSSSRSRQRLSLLYRLGTELNRLAEPDDVAAQLTDFVESAVGGDHVAVYLFDEEGDPVARASRGHDRDDGPVIEEILEGGRAVLHQGEPSVAAVPLAVREELVGVLVAERETEPILDDEDLRLLGILANQAAVILQNSVLFDEMREANRDLAEAKKEILEWNQALEGKVERRTEELRARKEEVEQLSAEKDRLLGMVAHDLRTPIGVVLGYAQHLQRDGIPPDELEEGLGTIENVALQIRRLLGDLLDLSTVRSGQIDIRPRRVDVREVLEECVHLHDLPARSNEVDLELDVPDDVPRVRADPGRTRQIVSNLVDNAVKHCPPETSVVISAVPAGRKVIIGVADDGPGMAPELAARIFEMGERGSDRVEGRGLGLAIARRLVELQDGEIRVETAEGEGTRFTFDVPVAEAVDADEGAKE